MFDINRDTFGDFQERAIVPLVDIAVIVTLTVILVAAVLLAALRDQVAGLVRTQSALAANGEQAQAKIKLLEESRQAAVALATQLQQQLDRLRPKRIIIPNEINGKVFFATGEDRIRRDFLPVLDSVLREVKSLLATGKYRQVNIQGFTDDVPVRAGVPYRDNWGLGAARALAVLRYLESHGVPAALLSATSNGEYDGLVPAGQRPSQDDRALRRRIEVILLAATEGEALR